MSSGGKAPEEDSATRLLGRALELPAEERSAFVAEACQGRPELEARLERLLRDAVEYDSRFDDGVPGALGDGLVRDLAEGSGRRRLEPGTRLGRYEIEERLGSGGMGVVFRARDPQLDRPVALKVLSESLDADAERFAREARAASALNHPHIATVYELGEDGGTTFIAMELVDGPSLHARMQQGAIPLAEVLELGAQVADALAAAHERGIVHRDLKPGNVVLSPERGVKLVDFGLAKRSPVGGEAAAEETLTSSGVLLGTVSYMSPEQAGGSKVDHRSDQFSLGAMLYELVAGRHPFRGANQVETLAAILRDAPRPLRGSAPHAPHWLERLVHRCLAKDPESRFTTTRELAWRLRARGEAVDGEGGSETRSCTGCSRPIGHEHRFCPYCGCSQASTCARCGAGLDPEAAFCSSCGTEVAGREDPTRADGASSSSALARSSALSGERRLATVVVSRLDGYSKLVDDLDPDRRRDLLEAVELRVRDIVEEEGGRLLRFSSGELLMVFGLQGAAEDDAGRGVNAAERLHRAFGAEARDAGATAAGALDPRAGDLLGIVFATGVYSGMVIIEPGGEGNLAVTGPAVEAAEHLSRRAEAGELRISSETRRLSESTTAHRNLLQIAAGEAGEDSGLSRFAGRDRELSALREAVDATRRGEGRFVEVVGEAGAGKSRLLHELRRCSIGDGARLVEGRCQSFGAGVPYLPLVGVLRGLLGFDEEASPEEQTETARAAITALGSDLEPYVPLFLNLLSPSETDQTPPQHLDRKHLRQTLQAAVVGLVTLAAARHPTVILLEDWHWVDEASHQVVRQLAELTTSHPLALVVTRRPEPPMVWPPLASPITLSLSPISLESAEEIVGSVLGGSRLAGEVTAALHQRSGGNPFFLEELCRSLLEERRLEESNGRLRLRGEVDSLVLPTTIHALLRARLDRVTGDSREVIRRAAVIGREFGADVLAATLGPETELEPALEQLRARGLIRQLRVFPDPEYTFQHILVQEAAYESLLRHQRVSLHGQVGRAIERVHAGRLEEHLERLAHHFAQAEMWSEAVAYGRRAARRAAALSHFEEALSMLDRAVAWLDRQPDAAGSSRDRTHLLLDKERLCETLGWRDEQTRVIEELIERLEPHGDSPEMADVLIRRGEMLAQVADYREGEAALQEARAMSSRLGDRVRERNSLRGRSFLYWHQQRFEEVVELLREALDIDRELGDRSAEVQDLANLGMTLRRLERTEEALGVLEEARELNREVKDDLRETYLLYMLSWVHRSLGDAEKAKQYLTPEEGYGADTAVERPYQMIALAHLALEQGQVDEALALLRQSEAACRKSGYRAGLAHSLRTRAETLIRLDRFEEAREAGLEAARLFARLGEAASELRLLAVCVPLVQHSSDPEVAQCVDRLIEVSRSLGRRDLEVQGLLARARFAEREGELERARASLLEALACCERTGPEASEPSRPGMPTGDVLNSLGIVEWGLGRYEDALARYRAALAFFQERGDRKHEGLMLNSLGATLRKLDRDEEAAAILLRAESVHRESGEELLRGHASALLGDIDRESGRPSEAERWYQQSLEIRRAIGDRTGEAWMLLRLAEVAHALGERERAEKLLDEADPLAAELADERIESERGRLAGALEGRECRDT